MSETCISSEHIQKLGHEILEIRERALHSIISKLERGYTFDNDLARSRELLSKLFDWFLLEPCTSEDLVLQLIKRILQSESGQLLQKHYGGSPIRAELQKIKTYLEPQYHQHIDDILQNIDITEVPPLISNVPLSYRSNETIDNAYDSTATPIELYITQKTSPEQLTGFDRSRIENCDHFFKNCALISQDVHVLQSIENSFKNPPDASSLLNSCEFFRDILLQDYPAEVFLQRPAIALFLQGLLKDCPSTRLATAVLECLSKLTHLLIVRVNFFGDPSVYNNKVPLENTSEVSTPRSEDIYKLNLNGLKEADFVPDLKQISLQKFCFNTMICLLDYICEKPNFNDDKMKLNRKQNCINGCVRLLHDLINLLSLCEQNSPRNIASFLNKFADTLEFFRIDLASNDSDPQQGIVYLSLLHICVMFLKKINPQQDILPANFKIALENTMLNPIVTRLHSELHDFLLEFLEKCNSEVGIVSLSKYRKLKSICDSMSAAVAVLKEHKSKNLAEGVLLAKNAILSLQFHRNLHFLKIIVETFATKPPSDDTKNDVKGVILSLLSHHLMEIKQEMYALCQQKVIAAVGPKLNVKKVGAPGTQIIFLLQPEILIEIALNGLTSENDRIHTSAEAILVYIIKSKILVSDKIWQKCIEAIIPALSVLLCYADRETPIGRTVSGILDPDVGKSLFLTNLEILKGNIELFFAKDSIIRNEAASRILWLLTAQENSKVLLPKICNLEDKTLNSVCQLKIVYDVNKNRNHQHYYESSNLKQVLKLLDSENVEPVIRRSALTQIGVMVEDHLLHRTFLENNGLRILLHVMRSALTEKNYEDYPDSIIPAVGILKYLCLYNASVRHELSCNLDVYCFVLRGLFLYLTEEHMKEDCSVVLFLLIFHDHIRGTPSNADFSLPILLFDKLKVPFCSQTYTTAPRADEQEKFADEFFSDSITLSALQLHWCLEWFGGVEEILKWDSIAEINGSEFDSRLLLTKYGLMLLKNSSLEYCSRRYLIDVQNSTTHLAVFENVAKLTGCVTLFTIILQANKTKPSIFFFLPWEKSFKKFLTVLPSGEADCTLLIAVLKLLSHLIPLYKTEEAPCWITTVIKNPKNCILELLEINTEAHSKILAQELLNLIVKSIQQERNYVSAVESQSWGAVFKIIANTLKLSDSQNFYNLAFLDCMLSALVHITGMVGWSCCNQKEVIFRTIAEICELLSVFHCGKGTTATDSVMGLSVTRNLLLLLNHLLAEIFNSEFKDWETCFLNETEDNDSILAILLQLLSSRDVVLRAAVLQLLCGLCTNARMALEVAREVVQEKVSIWEVAVATLLDNEEASVVRENCATLLTNLCSHLYNKEDDDSNTKIRIVLNLLEDYDFYKQLKEILTNLFLKSAVTNNNFVSTPALIKAVATFLCNLTALSKEDVISNLQEAGLIKQLFRSLSLPCASCENTKELALYRDVLEMNTQVCVLLNKAVVNEKSCISVLLHTRDCLSVLLSFLNPQLYYTYLPELVYLRNKLWNEIFGLLAVLVANATESGGVIASCIVESYKEPFLQTLCESISSRHSEELQQSALISLTSLLNIEEENSVHDILDSFRTPRNVSVEKNLENIEPFNFKNARFRTLEKVYFETAVPSAYLKTSNDDFLVAGAEICKILLHLYHITTLNNTTNFKKRSIVISTLTSLVGVSKEAKTYAFCHGLLEIIIQQIRELHIKLSLETAECTRRIISKKRVSPLLKELDALIGLLTNFLLDCEQIKNHSADLNLADLVHKLWVWFCFQKIELINVLKLLCTFTVDATAPAQSLAFTSPIAGSGPRKTPSNVTLLHAIVCLINKEMEQVSKTHDLTALKLSFEILENVCVAVECRAIMAKSNLFSTFTRLHPAITKRQKPWDFVEMLWLDFLQVFTSFPEGQAAVAKISEVLELIITLTTSAKATNRKEAVYVLRNIAFYQPNRPRLLMSSEFLNVLCTRLESGTMDEKNAVVSILWVLAANNQKAKLVLKCAGLDVKLQEILRQCHILESSFNACDVKRMHLVLKLLRENDK